MKSEAAGLDCIGVCVVYSNRRESEIRPTSEEADDDVIIICRITHDRRQIAGCF